MPSVGGHGPATAGQRLLDAAYDGDGAGLRALVKCGAPLEAREENGCTAFLLACFWGAFAYNTLYFA